MLIQLTEYETGNAVILDVTHIVAMRELGAAQYPTHGGPPHELGRRTRIDIAGDCILVNETAEEILKLAKIEPVRPATSETV